MTKIERLKRLGYLDNETSKKCDELTKEANKVVDKEIETLNDKLDYLLSL